MGIENRDRCADPQRIRLAALDMDGTLLRADKTLHPETEGDLAGAKASGIEPVLCTGRAPLELYEYVRELPSVRYGICISGALVYDFRDRRTIYENPVSTRWIPFLNDIADRYDAMLHFLTPDRSIIRKGMIARMADFEMGAYQPMYRRIATEVPDMVEEGRNRGDIFKVNIYFRSVPDRDQARGDVFAKLRSAQRLPGLEENLIGADTSDASLPLTVVRGENTTLEITSAGVDKAEGMRILAQYLNIPMSETMSIGDSENDLTALQAAAVSVAMGNADEKIRALCDCVTEDNDHNGVG
ncbi:MAG: HAD family hydrolase, partial [Lachnospiraceae bacterium]|nr:HAD family hydrolase [Lachnospiraceae bacterium]